MDAMSPKFSSDVNESPISAVTQGDSDAQPTARTLEAAELLGPPAECKWLNIMYDEAFVCLLQELLVSPYMLLQNNIPVVRCVQRPGEFIINYPGTLLFSMIMRMLYHVLWFY